MPNFIFIILASFAAYWGKLVIDIFHLPMIYFILPLIISIAIVILAYRTQNFLGQWNKKRAISFFVVLFIAIALELIFLNLSEFYLKRIGRSDLQNSLTAIIIALHWIPIGIVGRIKSFWLATIPIFLAGVLGLTLWQYNKYCDGYIAIICAISIWVWLLAMIWERKLKIAN